MNTLYLEPTDVLFFRDGRPMSGSLSGHGNAFPLPTVTNAALHAALHRAEIHGVHSHRRGRSGEYTETRDRKFGSLVSAGPFPVLKDNSWLFPRPLDAGEIDSTETTFFPLKQSPKEEPLDWKGTSSLPNPLTYAVANTKKPSKDTPASWWNSDAWACYLGSTEGKPAYYNDSTFTDSESTFGIGIDPISGTQDGERFYSAQYLRLKPGCRLGLFAEAQDKIDNSCDNKRDLIQSIFPNSGAKTPVIVGGQQRACTVQRESSDPIPLPIGQTTGFIESNGKYLVKWILLTPAIFPEIKPGISKRGTERKPHPGGWLPTWICPKSGEVLLQTVGKDERKKRRKLNACGKGYESKPDIDATLVAAIVGKPHNVTGYALPHEAAERISGAAKPTHLAVPAGSVYYFECNSEDAAKALAAALNWHGNGDASTIRNRRSTLFGEKGFGLGVCGTWDYHKGNLPT